MSIGRERCEPVSGGSSVRPRDAQGPARATPAQAERWIADHGDALWRFCLMRTRSRDVAEEVFQETILASIDRVSSFGGRSTERTWLLSIASHKIADHFRRLARDRRAAGSGSDSVSHGAASTFREDGCWASIPSPWQNPADESERSAQIAALRACLDKLGPGMSDAVWLRDILGVPSEEICEALGVTATNLWTRLHRARTALRDCVQSAMSERPRQGQSEKRR